MNNKQDYLSYLSQQYNSNTFRRKQDYIKYNFDNYFLSKINIKVLEIGPGLGELVSYLNEIGVENIDVIDNDQSILSYISQNFRIQNSFFLQNSMREFENRLATYDIIFLTQVLEHVQVDIQSDFISYLFSILNENGKLIITVPNGNNFLSITERYGDLTHTSMFTSNSLFQLFSNIDSNYKSVSICGYKIPPYSLINVLRIAFQKLLHFFILCLYIMNGGTYHSILTPNISMIISKNK